MDNPSRQELKDALVGKRIVDVDIDEENTDPGHWGYDGGDLTVTLDDGTVLSTGSWGHDAWGNYVSVEKP